MRKKKFKLTEKTDNGVLMTMLGMVILIIGYLTVRYIEIDLKYEMAIKIAFSLLGGYLAIKGLGQIILDIRRRDKQIEAYNTKISRRVNITRMEYLNNVGKKGFRPVRFVYTEVNPDDGKEYTYKSQYVIEDNEKVKQISKVSLYLHPIDKSIGYLDIYDAIAVMKWDEKIKEAKKAKEAKEAKEAEKNKADKKPVLETEAESAESKGAEENTQTPETNNTDDNGTNEDIIPKE